MYACGAIWYKIPLLCSQYSFYFFLFVEIMIYMQGAGYVYDPEDKSA
jgi:hypothetical protein